MGRRVEVDGDQLRLLLEVFSEIVDETYWRRDEDRVRAARDLAVVVGMDPFEVTSRHDGDEFPHAFDEMQGSFSAILGGRKCRLCHLPGPWHDPDGVLPPSPDLAPAPPAAEPVKMLPDGAFAVRPSKNTAGIPTLGGGIVSPPSFEQESTDAQEDQA